MKLPISACIITYNEERNISDCIKSLDFVDEIIVVDSGSQDTTQNIAKNLNATVIEHTFKGHIEQKNYALNQATNDWVIALDADERVSSKLKEEILNLFKNPDKIAGAYRFPRKTYYIDKWINHGGWYPDKHLRLFKKSIAKWGGRNPHDKIISQVPIAELKGDLLHYSFRSLSSHIKTINNFSGIMARNLYREGKTHFVISKMIFKSLWKFFEMYFLKLGLLDGRYGLVIASFSAFSTLAKYAKLFELKRMGFDGNYKDSDI